MDARIVNTLVLILAVVGICAANMILGRHWSRLDHNPWSGDFRGETFWGPTPGWNPGALDIGKIRQRGRVLMIAAPIASLLFLVVVITSSSRF
ncbi:conserved hypothetical protein [Sphingomonas sp. T1]|jgi:hypothetical protein|uniref:Uncharacterized protein n=1 Tax=Sphingomonas aerolata TaxID=185951 RepID=A0A2T4YQ22_9SPHN|nr:hypothetical protein [Sphingomonas sp. T1]PTM45604.1 hypothetical protein C8J24_1830 [Sphingomonas aerolata]VXC91592.1 conserved hypothetical protein [Sphingomonas sp. T1]